MLPSRLSVDLSVFKTDFVCAWIWSGLTMQTLVLSQTRKSGFHDKVLYETPTHIAILYSGQRSGRDDWRVLPHAVGGKFIRERTPILRECIGTILSAADVGKTPDGCRQFILVIEKASTPLTARTKCELLALLGLSVTDRMTGIALAVKTDSAASSPPIV